MSDFNGGSDNANLRRLDRMEDVIQSMITLVQTQSRMVQDQAAVWDRQHLQIMEEIRELISLQKEQRIDIMALFVGNKELRDSFKAYFEKNPSKTD
jgi:hypothetical protein